jgi:cellulose synthase/poly-beta-1,6-N-acetylglucosamine synthase-like glycosyltransferase
MEAVFWIAIFILFYTYIGYGLLLLMLNAVRKKSRIAGITYFPPVTLIVPAYNEADFIEKKIQNTLGLQYPDGLLSLFFITDGSTDATNEIVSRYPEITLLHQSVRKGKTAAVNRAMQQVATPYVVFTDGNTLLHPESIIKLVQHYKDASIGGVSGEKRIVAKDHSAVGFGERLYWQYESLLKKANGNFYTIIGAAGELFSIRTKLYQPVDSSIILDDFVISARVCQQGYRFSYEGDAYGIETSSVSIREERKRKIRISAGCFQSLTLFKDLLNPIKNFRVAFQYISHRVLRWVVCPLLLPLVFIINVTLFLAKPGLVYELFFWVQCAFYFLALLGKFLAGKKVNSRGLFIPYYFIFMILSQYGGFYRFATKKQPGVWEKANRKDFVGDAEFQ